MTYQHSHRKDSSRPGKGRDFLEQFLNSVPLPYALTVGLYWLTFVLLSFVARPPTGPRAESPVLGALLFGTRASLLGMYALMAHRWVLDYSYKALREFTASLDMKGNVDDVLLAPIPTTRMALVMAGGLVLGLLATRPWALLSGGVARLPMSLGTLVQSALGAWMLYGLVHQALIIRNLHRLPMKINIFDPQDLEPVARVGLVMSATILGALTLLLTMTTRATLRTARPILSHAVLLIAAVIVFFLTMYQTHRKMAQAKERELESTTEQLLRHYEKLHRRLDGHDLGGMMELSYTITALMAYEKRIREAPEWPYTAETLRNLGVSIVVPVATWLYQIFSDRLFG